jgi:hypothetical protein
MRENVKTAILQYCQNNEENIVLVVTDKKTFRTIFDKTGKTKTLERQVDIFTYIFNVVRFMAGLKDISINGINVGEFKLKELRHENYQ